MKIKMITPALLAFVSVFAHAQQTEQPEETSKWSASVKVTGNYFRTSPAPSSRLDRVHPGFGGTLEYGFTPFGGLGMELMYNPYGGELSNGSELKAGTFDVMPYYSINLSNLIVPNRTGFWEKVNIYSETGAGFSFYHYGIDNADATNRLGLVAKTGMNVAYRLGDALELGLESFYRYYDRSDLAGQSIGKGFSEGLTAGVNLRYKFGAKNKTHVRNMSAAQYHAPLNQDLMDEAAQARCKELQGRLTSAEAKQSQIENEIKNLSK